MTSLPGRDTGEASQERELVPGCFYVRTTEQRQTDVPENETNYDEKIEATS